MTNRQALNTIMSNDPEFNKAVMRLRKKRAWLVKKMEGQPLNVKLFAYREFDDFTFSLKAHKNALESLK